MLDQALKYLRKFNDVKLVELAKDLNISASYLSEVENGKKKPNLDLISKYAERFKVKRSAILFFSEEIEHNLKNHKLKPTYQKSLIKFLRIVDRLALTDDE